MCKQTLQASHPSDHHGVASVLKKTQGLAQFPKPGKYPEGDIPFREQLGSCLGWGTWMGGIAADKLRPGRTEGQKLALSKVTKRPSVYLVQ